MAMSARAELSERQLEILARVVEEYVATSLPVGSKVLVQRAAFGISSSTVRAELAELERLGLAERHGENVMLTARGRFLGDGVTAALLA